jgi:hypothetical protein
MKAPIIPKIIQLPKQFGGARIVRSVEFNPPQGLVINGYPANIQVDVDENGIVVTWDDLSTNEDSILVERSTDGISFVGLVVLSPDSATYIDPIASLDQDVPYQYRITYIRNHTYTRSTVSEPVTFTQVVTDAMLTEEEDFYMASEDEDHVYLQLIEEE